MRVRGLRGGGARQRTLKVVEAPERRRELLDELERAQTAVAVAVNAVVRTAGTNVLPVSSSRASELGGVDRRAEIEVDPSRLHAVLQLATGEAEGGHGNGELDAGRCTRLERHPQERLQLAHRSRDRSDRIG